MKKVISSTFLYNGDGCQGGVCPTIYEDNDNCFVQGYVLNDDEIKEFNIPNGESIVRVPKELIMKCIKK